MKSERKSPSEKFNLNDFLNDSIAYEVTIADLPSNQLLIISPEKNVNTVFGEFLKDKSKAKLIDSCGVYVYLSDLEILLFTINTDIDLKNLKKFIKLLLNHGMEVEFDEDIIA